MKFLSSFLIGSLLLSQTPAAHAATLYETVKKQMDLELRAEKVDDEVKDFIAAIAKERKWGITADEVDSIMAGSTDVCSKHEALNGLGCLDVLNEIRTIVSFENQVRITGRRLQAIATGYELPISEIPRKTQTLFGNLNAVVNVWKAGTQSPGQGVTKTIPSVAIEEKEGENLESLVGNLADKLEELEGDERIAAVWRYQYGARLVRDKRKPTFLAPDVQEKRKDEKGNEIDCKDGERRFLCKRWEDVENALEAIWTELLAQYQGRKDVPPTYYLVFPEEATKALPENIIVWARMDTDTAHPSGDVGLQWTTPLDPVFPTLTKEDEKPVLGGEYPPEPPKKDEQNTKVRLELERAGELDAGSGLCSMAFALKGYLCRPLEVKSGEGCPDPEEQDKDSIVLVSCKFQNFQKQTVAGPDVCSEIFWNQAQNSSAGSAEATSSSSSLDPSCGCNYTISCEASCEGGADGHTSLKDGNGNISVCIATKPVLPVPRKYVLSHELAHVRQFCALPPGSEPTNTQQGCCSYEYDAHLVNCGEMQADGLLGNSKLGISVDSCAAILANESCKRFGKNACSTIAQERVDDLINTMSAGGGDACPVPDSEKKKEINMCPCTPATLSGYGNTIGNNLCFIGQCVEQSLETHRVTPGRAPVGVQDEAFPYDDPLAGSPLGNFLTAPTTGQPILPPYNPLLPVREFESALCALSGLPAGAPSALCTISANRRTDSPLTDPLSTLMSMFQMEANHDLSVQEMESLAQSVGTRIGTDLYARNMRMMSKNLAEVIGIATKLLNEIKSIDFPDEMCAMGQDSAATPAQE